MLDLFHDLSQSHACSSEVDSSLLSVLLVLNLLPLVGDVFGIVLEYVTDSLWSIFFDHFKNLLEPLLGFIVSLFEVHLK